MTQQNVNKKWYVIRTFSGHEGKVKAYIEEEALRLKLDDRITNVLVPSEKVFEIKDGKKKSKTKTFFPGYILVEVILDKETKHLIVNTPSVMSFVGTKGEPVPLQPEEIRRLLGSMEEHKETEIVGVPFIIGDAVKVIDGPFNNFNGFVQEINKERMKLKVMVSIFGRKTPIELDFSQVEIEK
ncbi:MAG: transcription termination/antitermination protein NusG [Bacteroidetes bacterium]|nr:transcription termination/antitermination protein NusG [Bacteroidota bacterium]MBU2471173.1 transcription termination/antitermination protein NusG [Bacteroidota bacterium]MBU2636080.1 transcription termination/antitermination protein NusG [Bacteroidota bacterium]